MKDIFIPNAIDVLSRLFFRSATTNKYLAVSTLEFYIDHLKLLTDVSAVAKEIEAQKAFALVPKFYLFDSDGAEKVEMILKGD